MKRDTNLGKIVSRITLAGALLTASGCGVIEYVNEATRGDYVGSRQSAPPAPSTSGSNLPGDRYYYELNENNEPRYREKR